MSEYYLADVRAQERERQREQEANERHKKKPAQAQEMKVTLLGDFLFPSDEPQGFDPYNSSQGKPVREPWKQRYERR